jgi:hypothetical protein
MNNEQERMIMRQPLRQPLRILDFFMILVYSQWLIYANLEKG